MNRISSTAFSGLMENEYSRFNVNPLMFEVDVLVSDNYYSSSPVTVVI